MLGAWDVLGVLLWIHHAAEAQKLDGVEQDEHAMYQRRFLRDALVCFCGRLFDSRVDTASLWLLNAQICASNVNAG